MDLEGHYPQNTISYYIISNETQITLHFFQARISAMPKIRVKLFLAIFNTRVSLLTLSFVNVFTIFGYQLAKVWKKLVLVPI